MGRGLEWFVIAPTTRIAGLCHSVLRGEPFTTCSLACSYCYARWYRGPHGDPRPIPLVLGFVKAVSEAQRETGLLLPVRVATLSDPFQPAEKRYRIVKRVLKLASRLEVPVVLNTRVPPPSPAYWRLLGDLAGQGLLVLQVTITGGEWAWNLLSRIEPLSPPPRARLGLVGEASSRGIPVLVRLQPFIPGVTSIRVPELLEGAVERGARGFILEFLRGEKRLLETIASLAGARVEWEPYSVLGGDVYHPSLEYREAVARLIGFLAWRKRVFYATCKEGLFHTHTPFGRDCCGYWLFRGPVARRPTLLDAYWLLVRRGCLEPGRVFEELCRESSDVLLCGDVVEAFPSWLRRRLRAYEKRLLRILSSPSTVERLAPSIAYARGCYRARAPVYGSRE